MDLFNVWNCCADASHMWDTATRISTTVVVHHSPGLLADKKMLLLVV